MRKRLALFLAAAATLTTAFVDAPSQASTPTGDPVVWGVGDLCDSAGGCADVARLITQDAQTDAVLLAGDLAYDNGTRADFARFDSLFGSKTFADGVTLKYRSLFTPGNHEYRN